MRNGRQTLSAGLHNRPVCRAGTHTPGKLNSLPPRRAFLIRASTSPLLTWRHFIQSSNGTAMGLVGVGRDGDTASGLSLRISPELSRISLGRQLGGNAAQDCAESLGLLRSRKFSTRHASQHEVFDDQEAGPAFQGCGNAD